MSHTDRTRPPLPGPREPAERPDAGRTPSERPTADERQITVRPLRPADAGRLVELYVEYPGEHRTLGTPPVGRERVTDWLRDQVIGDDAEAFVAVRGTALLGHVVVAGPAGEPGELAVYVDPGAFDRGIGTALCRRAVAWADAVGRPLGLVVESGNRRARHVFRKVGFEELARDAGSCEMRRSVVDRGGSDG